MTQRERFAHDRPIHGPQELPHGLVSACAREYPESSRRMVIPHRLDIAFALLAADVQWEKP